MGAADRAVEPINPAMAALTRSQALSREAAGSRSGLRRELVVPFGAAGYVISYEITSPQLVMVLAVRHQHEPDFFYR